MSIPYLEGGCPHGQHVSDVVAHAWNPSTCELEAGGIQGQPQLGSCRTACASKTCLKQINKSSKILW